MVCISSSDLTKIFDVCISDSHPPTCTPSLTLPPPMSPFLGVAGCDVTTLPESRGSSPAIPPHTTVACRSPSTRLPPNHLCLRPFPRRPPRPLPHRQPHRPTGLRRPLNQPPPHILPDLNTDCPSTSLPEGPVLNLNACQFG